MTHITASVRGPYKRLSTWFQAAGTPVRLKMVLQLAEAEMSLPQLAELVDADAGLVFRQLTVLRDAGLVTMIRHGRQVGYRVTKGGEVDRFMRLVIGFANPHLHNS